MKGRRLTVSNEQINYDKAVASTLHYAGRLASHLKKKTGRPPNLHRFVSTHRRSLPTKETVTSIQKTKKETQNR